MGEMKNRMTLDMTQMRQEVTQASDQNMELARVVEKAGKETAHRLTEIEQDNEKRWEGMVEYNREGTKKHRKSYTA